MIKKKCLKCDYEWTPRISKIKTCPRCRSRFWYLQADGKCKICGQYFPILIIHHINGNHEDNRKSNKIRICYYCHEAIHHGMGNETHKRRRKGKTRNYIGTEAYSKINKLRKKLK